VSARKGDGQRDGVELTNLDQPLFDGAGTTKRALIDYLEAMSDRMVPVLADRTLSVIRVRPGQEPFMQKNVPKSTPDWVATTEVWADASKRDVRYALCNDRRTLLWFGNQRAVEFHPTLALAGSPSPTHLILDLDPPEGARFDVVVQTALLVRAALASAGLEAAVKTSGAKGLHLFVPLAPGTAVDDAAAATRAIAARAERLDPDMATTAFVKAERGGRVFVDSTRAGGATVVAAYSPRIRPGVPVSFPVAWHDLTATSPTDHTISNVVEQLDGTDPWRDLMPSPHTLPVDLVEEGHSIPVARVQAMHAGKRRARAERSGRNRP
jgi:bifunctional non-homologous end joining protein LigD